MKYQRIVLEKTQVETWMRILHGRTYKFWYETKFNTFAGPGNHAGDFEACWVHYSKGAISVNEDGSFKFFTYISDCQIVTINAEEFIIMSREYNLKQILK